MSERQLFQIRHKGSVVSAKKLGRQSTSFTSKKEAKKARDKLNGEVPEDKHDHVGCWNFYVAPGPDHWRTVYDCYGKRYKL